jgi:hypothetical protein
MALPTNVLYFRVLHSHFSTDFNMQIHFDFANLSMLSLRFYLISFRHDSYSGFS